jgi:crotonobetainyl-CoA:carnitine CoA-transferase CaiB-like acyl-CoA transferase
VGVGSLDGVRVLDLSRLLPGPACTWYLAGLGARVDRVEPVGAGDPTRSLPPFDGGTGVFFAALNAGDRSLALSLRDPAAPAVLGRLLGAYDVLVEGFRPGVLEALGLGPDVLQARFPRLVVARLSGYGQDGPWRDRPGHDLNYVGVSGALALSARADDGPHVPPVQLGDLGAALVAAMGIAAALFDRERTGRGRILDVSMTEAALSLAAPHVSTLTAEGRRARPGGELLTGGVPVYGTYVCADGRWLTVGALEPRFQRALGAEVGTLTREGLRDAFATRTRDEWVELLAQACVGPVLDPGELADHPQLAARGAVCRLGRATFVRPPLARADWAPGPVASLGEHSDVILAEAGLQPDEIAELRSGGIVA